MKQSGSPCPVDQSKFSKAPRLSAAILLLLAGSTGGILGCAGQKEFQQTARITLGQTTEYENLINQKAAAENAYAKTMIEILQASARREAYNSEQVIVSERRNAFAAQVMKEGGKTSAAEVTDFTTGVITAVATDRATSDSLEKEYAGTLPASLAKINADTAALTPVTTDLTELQSDQSTTDQLKTWITFGSELKSKYQSTSEKSK